MIYAIGDIHGQLVMLEPALAYLLKILRPNDAVIFLGDYIDRGEQSADVLTRLIQFKKQHPATVFLRGNHEDMFLRAQQGDRRREELWLLNGGFATLKSLGLDGDKDWKRKAPKWVLDFLNATEIAVKSERYHFVHAGILPEGMDSGIERDLDYRMWVREPFLRWGVSPGRVVVFGHTPQADHRPLIQSDKIGLDTGASQAGGRLSVAGFDDSIPRKVLPEFTLFQVLENGTLMPEEMIRYGQSTPLHREQPPVIEPAPPPVRRPLASPKPSAGLL
jgi:serine/threonine protein phosphatase 1